MKRLTLAVCVCLLSGCLLKQNDPEPPKLTKIKGAMIMDDTQVTNQGGIAEFAAAFELVPEETAPVAATLSNLPGKQAAVTQVFQAGDSRAVVCEKGVYKKVTADPNAPEVESPYLNLGPLGFGPSLQSELTILDADKEKRDYHAYINPEIPAGLYTVGVTGNEQVNPFQEIVSMPEDVAHLRFNGKDFGDPTWSFNPHQNLDLFWREPAVENGLNAILVELRAYEADKIYRVLCGKFEAAVPSEDGHKLWNIEKSWFAEFPPSSPVDFWFVRAHQSRMKREVTDISISGARTYYGRIH